MCSLRCFCFFKHPLCIPPMYLGCALLFLFGVFNILLVTYKKDIVPGIWKYLIWKKKHFGVVNVVFLLFDVDSLGISDTLIPKRTQEKK